MRNTIRNPKPKIRNRTMGKATITSGGANGLYKINYHVDRTRIQGQIDAITQKIIVETQNIASLQTTVDAKLAILNARLADLDAAINAEANPRPATTAVMIARDAHTQAVNALDTAKMELTAIKFRKVQLEQILPPASYETSAWCADLNENLSGDVGVLEIPGERMTPVIIKPAGEDGTLAAYIQHKDGIMVPVPGISPEIFFYNLAMFPAWQKWMPGSRLGTITAFNSDDGDLCSVTLDSAVSSQQGLNINKTTSLTNVPIVYMSCNGAAFETGDRVVIKYTGSGPGTEYTPTVIGFESNPKMCCPDFSGAGQISGTTEVPVGEAVIFTRGTSDNGGVGKFQLWDYGDGGHAHFDNTDIFQNTIAIQQYGAAGTYTVKRSLSTSVIWENISSSVITNRREEIRGGGSQETEALAWTAYLAASFVASSTTENSAWHRLDVPSELQYLYTSKKFITDIDLTAYDDSKKIFLAVAKEVRDNSESGIESSLGGSVTASLMGVRNWYNLIDLTSFAGQTLTDFEIRDNNGFPRLTDFGADTGWRVFQSQRGNPGIFIYRKQDPVCTTTKTDYINVT